MRLIGTDTSQTFVDRARGQFEPGTIGWADNKGWVFLQADGAIEENDACEILLATKQARAMPAAPAYGNGVCVSNKDVADDEYAWFCIWGDLNVNAKPASANTELSSSSTAGHLDDSGGRDLIGIVLTAARTSTDGAAPARLQFPMVAFP